MDSLKLFSGGFPLTLERLQFLQDANKKAFADLSKIAGTGNIIVSGVVNTNGTLSDGVVIIAGEVFPFIGGPAATKVRIKETSVNVPYNEDADGDDSLDLKKADTIREAVCSDTSDPSFTPEEYLLSSFVRIGNLQQMAPPIGAVQMYHGDPADLPYFWRVCDGANGTPDLRGLFVAGAGDRAEDYALATTGGAKEVKLTKAQLPNYNLTGSTGSNGNHSHTYQKSVDGRGYDTKSDDNPHGQYQTSNTSSAGAHTHSISLASGGSDQAHENRPPFFALYYIMFVGF